MGAFLEKIKKEPSFLQRIKNQTTELCVEAIKQDVYALQYVKEQTPELCELAVRKNGLALQYVKEQTPELCHLAVKKTGYSLEYVKEQTPELCRLAVKKSPWSVIFVKEKEKIVMARLFGTQKKDLILWKSPYGSILQIDCWVGTLDEFKAQVWERFECGFEYHTKYEVEQIVQKLEEQY